MISEHAGIRWGGACGAARGAPSCLMLIPWQALQLVGRLPCLLSCTMHPSPQGLHMPHGAYRALRTAHMGERVCVFEPVCVDGLAPQARASLESCTRPSGTAQW